MLHSEEKWALWDMEQVHSGICKLGQFELYLAGWAHCCTQDFNSHEPQTNIILVTAMYVITTTLQQPSNNPILYPQDLLRCGFHLISSLGGDGRHSYLCPQKPALARHCKWVCWELTAEDGTVPTTTPHTRWVGIGRQQHISSTLVFISELI